MRVSVNTRSVWVYGDIVQLSNLVKCRWLDICLIIMVARSLSVHELINVLALFSSHVVIIMLWPYVK